MSLPTRGETFAQLTEWLRRAQESSATLAHLYRDDQGTGRAMAMGWMAISAALKQMEKSVIKLATKGRLN